MPQRSNPWPIVAGVAIVAAGAILLFRDDDQPEPPVSPDAHPCPEGQVWSSAHGACVAADVPAPPASTLIAHGPNPRILVVGGELALRTAEALDFVLVSHQHQTGQPVAPANTMVWSGQGPSQVELFAQSIRAHGGLPTAVVDSQPEVAIVILGEYNAAKGPSDDHTLSDLVSVLEPVQQLLPGVTSLGLPRTNIVLVKPWQQSLEHTLDLAPLYDAAALHAAGRVFPFMPKRSDIMMEPDGIYPTPEGYYALARQIAALLIPKASS